MDAPPAAAADKLDGVVDDARLEESGYVLLDGLDAPREGDYERVLDRPRDRAGKCCEWCSLKRGVQDEVHDPWCLPLKQWLDRLRGGDP